MKVLVWMPPWAAHGDPLFYRNCLNKHLIPQANLLASAGCQVQVVLPELLDASRSELFDAIKVVGISVQQQIALVGDLGDPSLSLYREDDPALIDRMAANLGTLLDEQYDVILLWETPVPFLEKLFPDALIVHQMPGVFSRSPYPHTVTFDPVGLYRRGSLYLNAQQIKETKAEPALLSMTERFSQHVRSAINAVQPFDRALLDPRQKYEHLILLPLQVSAHYAFQADTPYRNQTDFLLDTLSRCDEKTGLVVTQYVTPRVQDTVLSKDVLAALRKRWPNLIFREEFDRTSSVSQYLLPLVDEVITCSSSIGLQAMAWPRALSVPHETFMAPFASQTHTLNGTTDRDRFTNTLAFLLGKNQPLASSVLEDKNFLLALLTEMLARKRAGAMGTDLLPAFTEIDSTYSEKLFAGFKTERAARDLERAGEVWSARQAELNKFNRMLNSPETKVVTFDVFDTLIKRPVEVPADAYKFLESQALQATGGIAEDFARVRLNAEVETRAVSTRGEITLDEIYEAVRDHYGLDDEQVSALRRIEIEMEVNFIQARSFGRRLWELAVESGKPIYIISDMYLPLDVIERMVRKAGYSGYRKLFLSSVYQVRKKEGALFDAVLKELNATPSSVLHIGDNRVADIEQAQIRGMKTFRLLRAVDRMRGNDYYKNIYQAKSGAGEKARSVIAGLTAHVLFDSPSGPHEKTSHFHGNPNNLGYAALGPLLTGYMIWLGRQAQRDGISRLYFLSREGWILKQIYDAIHAKIKDAIPSVYLYASRRATRVASLKSKGDVLALAGQPYKNGVSISELLSSRFGIMAESIPEETWQEFDYVGPEEKLQSDASGRMKFSNFCRGISDCILINANRERAGYMAYLESSGLLAEEHPAVVDIGWRANMQGALGSLLSKSLTGYYYATLQGAEVWKTQGHKIWAYLGDMVAMNHPSHVVNNRHLLEYLTCHVEPSLVRIDLCGDVLKPIFRTEDGIGERRLLIEDIHCGAIKFAMDLNCEFGHAINQIWIDPFLSERLLSSFITNPSSVDAAMFVGHHFEDAMGGVRRQYIIHPSAKNSTTDSVWKAGALVVHAKTQPSQIKPVAKILPSQGRPSSNSMVAASFDKESSIAIPSVLSRIESKVIKAFWAEKLHAKYLRDREAFFVDSRNFIAKAWYKYCQF